MTRPALVSLVGAGPGNPGLLTLRGLACLREADLVLYDKLVPTDMLESANPAARRVCVTDLGPCHVDRYLPVQDLLIAEARAGVRVVRLKGGDPCLFGRGGEEAQALAEAGIPFEIVPGVTAALGASAFAGFPLTHRRHASAVAFITGHENPGKPETLLDWAALARFPGTLVVYMGMARLDRIVASLLAEGKDPATPSAVVEHATTGEQKTVTAPLRDLPHFVRHAGIAAPALILIGSVVDLRESLNWFEKKPLFGKRVLVTRPRHQAGELVERLLDWGAVPLVLPAVEVRPPDDWAPVDAVLDRLADFRWLVFTSANGVRFFLDRLLHSGRDLRALGSLRLAAIGPRTAEVLEEYRLRADLVPPRFQSEDLAAALLPLLQPGDRVLLARADRGRDILREELSRMATVEQVPVYSQVDAVLDVEPILDRFRRGEIDAVTLTSSNIARVLLTHLDETCRQRILNGRTLLVSISPVTSAEIRRLGFEPAREAAHATMEGILEALREVFGDVPGP